MLLHNNVPESKTNKQMFTVLFVFTFYQFLLYIPPNLERKIKKPWYF